MPVPSFLCGSPKVPSSPKATDRIHLSRQSSGIGDRSVMHSNSMFSQKVKNDGYRNDPEVDYDAGASVLYKCIENRDWDGAMSRLESHPDEVKTWVSRKEQNSTKTRWRLLPIHATCIFRSPLALIEALIDVYREGPQMADDQGMLPVHLACRNGASKGVVLTLLQAYPESCYVRDNKNRVPLELVQASSSQNAESVSNAIRQFRRELESGEVVHTTVPTTSAPGAASIASSKKATPVDTVSVKESAPNGTNEGDYEHRTVLFGLVLKKDWKAAIARASSTPEEAGTWIVTKGFNGNLRFLPIHKACVLNPPDSVIQALLDAFLEGSKSTDQDGWLPIHCASFYGANARVISALLDANPKGTQSKDDEGRLPLHYACLKGASQEVVDTLLGGFPKASMSKDDEGRLPIHHACSKGAPEGVIDALLKASPKGAQSKDDQGRLPLHHACRKNATERIIRTLLRVYPRAAQIKDDQDKLPVHYACQNGTAPSIVTVLLSTYPESINVKNGFGYTPLAEAKAIDSPKMKPVISVLEKFKAEQDKIKGDSSETTKLEQKLDQLSRRVVVMETLLGNVMDLGTELKANVKKAKDPYVLIDQLADRLSNLDLPAGEQSTKTATSTSTPTRKLSSVFGRNKHRK